MLSSAYSEGNLKPIRSWNLSIFAVCGFMGSDQRNEFISPPIRSCLFKPAQSHAFPPSDTFLLAVLRAVIHMGMGIFMQHILCSLFFSKSFYSVHTVQFTTADESVERKGIQRSKRQGDFLIYVYLTGSNIVISSATSEVHTIVRFYEMR